MKPQNPFSSAFVVTEEAPGAWKNGTRVCKTKSEPGDGHRDGDIGTVTGSLGPTSIGGRQTYMYFVRFDDDRPPCSVAIVDFRIRKIA